MVKVPKNLPTGNDAPVAEDTRAQDAATAIDASVFNPGNELREWLTEALDGMKVLSGYLTNSEQQSKFDEALKPLVAACNLAGAPFRKQEDSRQTTFGAMMHQAVNGDLNRSDPT